MIRAHLRFLADDLLEGRATGTRGYDLAANYVAAVLEAAGMEAALADESYLQPVPLRKPEVVDASLSITTEAGGTLLIHREEFAPVGNESSNQSSACGSVVFVGHGVRAPALGIDDYLGVDAKGKIVIALAGAPETLESATRAHHSSEEVKAEVAEARGAVGLIIVPTYSQLERFPWSRLAEHITEGHRRWREIEGGSPQDESDLVVRAWLHPQAVEALFKDGPTTLKVASSLASAGKRTSVDLPAQLCLTILSRHHDSESNNVLGLWPGSDPELRREVVVVTAHLDHLGVGEAVDGDAIYNGAYDNASGVSVMLAVAEALAQSDARPRRSILFAATTAEEEGLVGADYLAGHLPEGVGEVVAALNLDGSLMFFPVSDVTAIGANHSSLGRNVNAAAASAGRAVSPDPLPDLLLFVKSDQYPFVRRGIPSLFLINGLRAVDAEIDGVKELGRWLEETYHSPRDDFDQPIDFEEGSRFAQWVLDLVQDIADDESAPEWLPGSGFDLEARQ